MLTDNEIIVGLATIVVFGVGSQWMGRRLGIPSLLLLLPAGVLAGDVLGLVEPEKLFGDLLNPTATLLVGLLLFQSGLQLRLDDLQRDARGSVARLVTIGAAITFVGGAATVALALDVPTELAWLTGAILVVSGPTVVGPLLAAVRPKEPTGAVLRWEGTVLDPLGATLGVVVLNLVIASERGGLHPVLQMLGRLGIGVGFGLVAAFVLVFVISRFLLTDEMEPSVAVLLAVAAFAAAELVLTEAGLFATVAMGVAIANQRTVSTRRIAGFGETLEVLIIGGLFIVLGAVVEVATIREHLGAVVVIVAVLVLVVRPLTAAVSLIGSPLAARERVVVGAVDPRGVVAAATASGFTVSLGASGYDADFLLPVVFGVIVGTGIVYGLGAPPVARWLGVAQPEPTTVALVGDDPWLLELGERLGELGVKTLMVTSEPLEGRGPWTHGVDPPSYVSLADGPDVLAEEVGRAELGSALVSVPPAATLTLVEPVLIEHLGRRRVLRIPHEPDDGASPRLSGDRLLRRRLGEPVDRRSVQDRLDAGAEVEVFSAPIPTDALALASVDGEGVPNLRPMADPPEPGDRVIVVADTD